MMDEIGPGTLTELVEQVLRSFRDRAAKAGDVASIAAQVRNEAAGESEIVEELTRLGRDASGSPPAREAAEGAARALFALRTPLRQSDAVLVEQALSPDGRFAVWTLRRRDGGFFVKTGAFRDARGAAGSVVRPGVDGLIRTRDEVAAAARLWKEGLWAPRVDGAWTNDALRTSIMEYLDTVSSFEAQRRYQDKVPIAQVPAEMFYQWQGKVDPDFLDDFHEPVYPPAEQAAIRRFHAVWESVFRDLPVELPSLADVEATEPWGRLRSGAAEALAVFARRGRTGTEGPSGP